MRHKGCRLCQQRPPSTERRRRRRDALARHPDRGPNPRRWATPPDRGPSPRRFAGAGRHGPPRTTRHNIAGHRGPPGSVGLTTPIPAGPRPLLRDPQPPPPQESAKAPVVDHHRPLVVRKWGACVRSRRFDHTDVMSDTERHTRSPQYHYRRWTSHRNTALKKTAAPLNA